MDAGQSHVREPMPELTDAFDGGGLDEGKWLNPDPG